jgi:hypothetical protein
MLSSLFPFLKLSRRSSLVGLIRKRRRNQRPLNLNISKFSSTLFELTIDLTPNPIFAVLWNGPRRLLIRAFGHNIMG